MTLRVEDPSVVYPTNLPALDGEPGITSLALSRAFGRSQGVVDLALSIRWDRFPDAKVRPHLVVFKGVESRIGCLAFNRPATRLMIRARVARGRERERLFGADA